MFQIVFNESTNFFEVLTTNQIRRKVITIDGVSESALPIRAFGFKPNDFNSIELNEFGLKEIARHNNEVLVLTANNLFVVYSDGLPSLQGMPSHNKEVSGVWADKEGNVKLPRFTLYTKQTLATNFMLCIQTSFRYIPEEVLELICFVSSINKYNISKDLIGYADRYSLTGANSRYLKLYPGYKHEHDAFFSHYLDTRKYALTDSNELSWFTTTL